MMKNKSTWQTIWMFFILILLPMSVYSQTAEVVPGLNLDFELPGNRWQVSKEAPQFLIQERAMHIHDNMMKRFQKKGISTKMEAAEFQLKATELFIYNPQTGAYLEIDFSPLKEGEKVPSRKTIAKSAQYTGEELEHEEGLSQVKQQNMKTTVQGAKYAFRVDAEFLKHGEAKRFVGIIGFVDRYWFFLYFTASQESKRDLADMEKIIDSFIISRPAM